MSEQNENREKLLECAKKEFLEKGFNKASLRKITSEAGLTTGAVYFFFKDKEGLFGAVVQKPLEMIDSVISEHFRQDGETDLAAYRHQKGDHDEFAAELIDAMYDDYDAIMILLHHAAGSEYENITDRFIAMLEKYYIVFAQRYAQLFEGKKVNMYMLHWLCHIQIGAFVHLLEHEPDKEKAKKHISPIMDMLIKSWMELILEDE